jgi:hypothetical protein
MAKIHTLRDPDNFLLHALREDAFDTMHALFSRFERTKIFTGRLLCVADAVFGKLERDNDCTNSNMIVRSAFLGGAAVADQTFGDTPGIMTKDRVVTRIRSLSQPLENGLIYPESQEAAGDVVMLIAESCLKTQPSLLILANEVGRIYGINPDMPAQTKTAEYDAALMGVGYLASLYTDAMKSKVLVK